MHKKLKVYLAGKISSNGWRQSIVDIRNNFSGDEKWKIRNGETIRYSYKIEIVGPFFLSCDHSCYHGENSHGVGLNSIYQAHGASGDCYGQTDTFTEKEVNEICLKQICRSDVLFAYIDCNDCYGTLSEIGFARSLDKTIIIVFDNINRMKDMWFIKEMADRVECLNIIGSNLVSIKDMFERLMAEQIVK